jgi:hypothetical protein
MRCVAPLVLLFCVGCACEPRQSPSGPRTESTQPEASGDGDHAPSGTPTGDGDRAASPLEEVAIETDLLALAGDLRPVLLQPELFRGTLQHGILTGAVREGELVRASASTQRPGWPRSDTPPPVSVELSHVTDPVHGAFHATFRVTGTRRDTVLGELLSLYPVALHGPAHSTRQLDERFGVSREPAPSDLRGVRAGDEAVCWVVAIRAVRRDEATLTLPIECLHGRVRTPLRLEADAARWREVCAVLPTRKVRVRMRTRGSVELLEVLSAPWANPSRGLPDRSDAAPPFRLQDL